MITVEEYLAKTGYCAELKSANEKLRTMLKKHQFALGFCRSCAQHRQSGCAHDCEINQLLEETYE